MKRINCFFLTVMFFLLVIPFVSSGTGAWAGDGDLIPTAKSTAGVNHSLLRNIVDAQQGAAGTVQTVSADSSDFPTIKLSVTVQDATGAYIHNLTADDFSVTEQSDMENSPVVQAVESVTELLDDNGTGGTGESVSLGFLFDISGSIEYPWLNQAKQAAVCLLENMRATDQAMLMSFSTPGSAFEILPPGSPAMDNDGNGISDYAEEINNLDILGSSTAIYDAMAEAISIMETETDPKAILLFTDGLSNRDQIYDINDVIQMATTAGVPVYTLNFGDEQQNLLNLASLTGGAAINTPKCLDLLDIYNSLSTSQENIPGTYSIIYTTHNSLNDGTTRTVNVMYDGTSRTATYTASQGQNTGCTKNCGGGTGCFIQTAGDSGTTNLRAILFSMFLFLAAGGLFFLLRKYPFCKRNMTVFLVIFALAITFGTPDTGQAGLRSGAASISAMGGLYYFDDDQEIEKGPVAGLGLGYQWADNWGVELMLNYGKYDFNYLLPGQCRCLTDDVTVTLGRIDLLYHLWPDNDLVPYLAVGLGGISLDFDSFDKEDDAFADYGGGVQYFLSENIALRADVRGIYTFDDSYSNLAATVGVSFLLGGKGGRAAGPPQTRTGGEYIPPTPPAAGVLGKEEMLTEEHMPPPVAIAGGFRILFSFDKSDINPAYYDNFKQVADYLKRYKETVLRIEGHTDSVGSEEYNQALSRIRAMNVRKYLSTNFNVPKSRMHIVGLGESKPVADNATSNGRRLNRRAELHYLVPAPALKLTGFSIRFGFDDDEINPSLHDKFKQVADYLRRYQDIILGIEGYTDTFGPESYNMELSLRRARSVGQYLSTNFHIPYDRMQFVGMGESSTAGDNSTLKGRQLNRRVELKYLK